MEGTLARERIIIAGGDAVIVLSLRTVLQSVGCTVVAGARSHREAIDVLIPASTRNALMTGRYDFLGQLLDAAPQVRETADKLPYVDAFA